MGKREQHVSGKVEFLRRAEAAYERMMKEDQEQMRTFEQMEERTLEVGRKLETWLMHECLEETARARAAGPAAGCPRCHKPLRMLSAKEREVRARCGPVAIRRPQGYCPSCRKAFFPSGPAVEAGD